MILDHENHRKQILALLTMPQLSISRDGETDLEQAAKDYLSLIEAVKSASVASPERFAHVLPVPED